MRKTVRLTLILSAAVAMCLAAGFLYYAGILHINIPGRTAYPVAGVDVSAHQGDIDWDTLSSQRISFAYIKATEGSSFTDSCFAYNWEHAAETDLRIGAYHFFSFESPGATQAQHFIETVSQVDNMLPPCVDVEFYGRFGSADAMNVPAVVQELRDYVDAVTKAYGTKPLIYASNATYETLIRNNFDDCDLWLRSVYTGVRNDADWTFWQYSNRFKLAGYKGREKFIDMNVFRGTEEDFLTYP